MIDSKMVYKFEEMIKEAISLQINNIIINNTDKCSEIYFEDKKIETVYIQSLPETIFHLLKISSTEKFNSSIEQFGSVDYLVDGIMKNITYKSRAKEENEFSINLKIFPSLQHRYRA